MAMNRSSRHKHVPQSLVLRMLYYTWLGLSKIPRFALSEFRSFFSTPPKSDLTQNFWLKARYHINSMGLWCAVGIAIIHLVFYIIIVNNPENIPNFNIHFDGHSSFTVLRNFNYRAAFFLQNLGFHLINTFLFTIFLIVWLYLHYMHTHLSKKMSLIFCIIYVTINNIESLTSLSTSFANVWLIMAPIIIIPAVGNRYSFPLLLVNILLHHLLVSYDPDPYDILTSISSFFVAIFIMMMQMEYYRREVRLHEAANRIRERVSEIELIKENIDSGFMLLDLELKVRPNFNDMCIKMLHRRNLYNEYFPRLLRNIVEENQFFINSMHYTSNPEGDDYFIEDPNEWEERIKHYFEMLRTGQLDADELALIDPLKNIKIYSYEGRSYISFHVSTIKVHNRIKYFMILISNDTGRVAGRFRVREHEHKHLERAELLFALSHKNPTMQLGAFQTFAKCYSVLCKSVLTELRSTIPPQELVSTVRNQLAIIHTTFQELGLNNYLATIDILLQNCDGFNKIELEYSSNVMIINKSTQDQYILLIIECEKFLHKFRSLFSIAIFFIHEPQLAENLRKQKQELHYGLSQDTLQSNEATDFYDTPLSPEALIFMNLHAVLEMLLSRHDLRKELELFEQHFDKPLSSSPGQKTTGN